MSHRSVARALLFALCYSLAPLTVGAQSAALKPSVKPSGLGVVKLRLRISVVEADSGQPVPKAGITIRRVGRSEDGRPLSDIVGTTDDAGDFDRSNTAFQLGAEPHRLEVAAPGYEELKLELPDSVLREAAGSERSFVMSVALSRIGPPPVSASTVKPESGNVNVNNVNAAEGTPTDYESRGFLANAASVLLFYFNKALWWLGLASVFALTAYGVARFLGYDTAFRRGPDPRDGRTQDYLRLIEVRLNEVQHTLQRSAQHGPPRPDVGSDEHVKRMDALLEQLEHLARGRIAEPRGANDATSHQTIESLSRLEQQFAGKLGRLSDAVKEIHGLVSTLLVEARWGQDGHAPDSTPGIDNRPPSQPTAAPTTQGGWPRAGGGDGEAEPSQPLAIPRFLSQAERARVSYRSLLDGQPSRPEPLYLDSEGTSFIIGKLEDSSVYLKQVGHTQGTFVVFTEDGKTGYVFPNPALWFQGPALHEVFPGLTEAEFNGAKQRIEPVPVTRVGERRWKVDRRILEL